MQGLEKTPDLLQELKAIETFSDIDDASLNWLIDHCNYDSYAAGESLFIPGEAADEMIIILEGEYEVRMEEKRGAKIVGRWGKGVITGVLPFSRMKTTSVIAKVLHPLRCLKLHRNCFTEMVNVDYGLVQNLVARMSDRIRDFQHFRYQDEKLISLGKLSAGLAHELNNPAAAMVRSADELYRQIHSTPEKFKAIMTMRITAEQTDQVNDVIFKKLQNSTGLDKLSMLEKEERRDEIMDWLEDEGIEGGEDVAETLLAFDFGTDDLDQVKETVNGQHLASLLWWIESTLSLERLVIEIKESADRIADLIKSVKSYSHMDRSVDMELINIHDGIRSTLTMLKHKLKKKSIQLELSLDNDLPQINAFPGELNQVWTNLIDNAADAVEQGGQIHIQTQMDREYLIVRIRDNGKGIPENIKSNIFDPFFTTKPMGEGTGLGLDIVRRIIDHHHAHISVESQPGQTEFILRFPTGN